MSKKRRTRMSEGADEDTLKALREKFRHATAVALQIPEEMIPMQVDRNSSKHITMEMWAEAGSFDMIAEPGDTVDEEIAKMFYGCNYMPSDLTFFQSKPAIGQYWATSANTIFSPMRPTFATFKKNRSGLWVYLGNCFKGETEAKPYIGY